MELNTNIITRQKRIYKLMQEIYEVKKNISFMDDRIEEYKIELTQDIPDSLEAYKSSDISTSIDEFRYLKMKSRLKLDKLSRELELLR